jgi:hypothetical protein
VTIPDITSYVDIEAPPPGPSAHLLFGTNQIAPVAVVAERYHSGLAPLIIATGGVNRHDGSNEAQQFRRLLVAKDVPDAVIRSEDTSRNTWENVLNALPSLHEALATGLPITVVTKWYHRRAIHSLMTLLPALASCHAITWEPIYDEAPVTRTTWPEHPGGRTRVIRERDEVRAGVAAQAFRPLELTDGAWR